MSKHCIVTPDIVGPIKNGGIGTHCHWLARFLRESGREVTVLFTGPMVNGDEHRWKKFYADLGIDFRWLEAQVTRRYDLRAFPLQQRSYDVYRFLDAQHFDVVHFQEWQGNGLQTFQARRTLGRFPSTCLTVTLHSNTRWIAEGGRHWYRRPIEDAMTSWAEAFMAQHADMVFSPSRYMLEWVAQKGWTVAGRQSVIPPCSGGQARQPETVRAQEGVLAFFGRLESRKGLEVFLKALASLAPESRAKIRKVHFVGRVGLVGTVSADQAIAKALTSLGLPFQLHSDLDSDSAKALLLNLKASVFMPSLADNYPLTVAEAAGLGLPVYASRVGGIPEIVDDAHLFEPKPASLAASICFALENTDVPTVSSYDEVSVRDRWIKSMEQCEAIAAGQDALVSTSAQPLISICVPYYNYPDYLPKLIESLNGSIYRNFEVIIVDDGSPMPRAQQVFDELKARRHDIDIRFERKQNGGVGETRNAAASLARGDYLVFMDADNLAKPEMLSIFVDAMTRTCADIVTCYFDAFEQHKDPVGEDDIHHVYAPAGPALEVGWAENVFGDANFCIRRSAFEAIGGFGTERESSWEDWEFLVRAGLAGLAIEVAPKSLFWYRYTDEGFSRNTDPYLNQRRLMRAFLASAAPRMSPVFEVMSQVALTGGKHAVKTPAGRIAGAIADRIYVKLGSPEGRLAQSLEKFFKRFIN